tara:strand:+ start:452 stop:1126 length:675 start_codon:yes stop_codon:yes gene_type:complete
MRRILLWGGKAKARIIEKMIIDQKDKDVEIPFIYDPLLKQLPFKSSAKFISSSNDLKQALPEITHFITCIGGEHGYARYKISCELEKLGLKSVDVISSKAILDDIENKGNGFQIMPGAVIHKFCSIGDYCVVNTNATVDHECIIGNGVHIMGGASIAGQVEVDDFSTIGTNATVLPNIRIGKHSYIGAGALVNKDVNDYEVVVGVPARKIRKHEPKVDLSFFKQ